MEHQTQVRSVKVKSRAARLQQEQSRAVELPQKPGWGQTFLQLDRLARNLVVVGCLFMVVVAVKNTSMPQAQSVFGAIQQSAGMEWDESVGKLTFVNALLPQSIQTVWNEKETQPVYAPINGIVVHAWSAAEPYVMIDSALSDVRAAMDGEVMSIAHGMNEERILRIRHDDGTEALYGNLEDCHAEVGDRVYAGDVIARLLQGHPLAFEWREEGRSVDPYKRVRMQEP